MDKQDKEAIFAGIRALAAAGREGFEALKEGLEAGEVTQTDIDECASWLADLESE